MITVIGNGGREDALRRTLAASSLDLTIIGPEQSLLDGLADQLRIKGKSVVGPGVDGARIEGSKTWMKELLTEVDVPTARYRTFVAGEDPIAYLVDQRPPYVIKEDGLASGKGVLVTSDLYIATMDALNKLTRGPILIEEFLEGKELSVTALANGKECILLPSARDYKRLFDNDRGPNTGGMGCFSPVPDTLAEDIQLAFAERVLAGLRRQNIDYRGFLYLGLMLTADGPRVLEINARLGDPEAQTILPRINATEFANSLETAACGKPMLPVTKIDTASVTVTLASRGYPDDPQTGDRIYGVDLASSIPGVEIYLGAAENFITSGGRILYANAVGTTIEKARNLAYEAVRQITWHGMQYRTDIAIT